PAAGLPAHRQAGRYRPDRAGTRRSAGPGGARRWRTANSADGRNRERCRMNAAALSAGYPVSRTQLVDVRRRALLMAQFRVLLIALVFVGLALAALLRLAYLGVVQPAPGQRSMADALLPPRGELTDRNGVPLARAFPAYALWFNPQAMDDGGPPLVRSPRAVAAQLKAIFPDLDEAELVQQLSSGKGSYLRRRVLPEDANKVMALGEL